MLTWIGFDAFNSLLYFMDSLGMVSALMNVASWQSIPVLDTFATRKSVDHIYWPVAVKNGRLVYVLLNGELKPAVYPQPITSVKAFQMPVLLQEGGGKEREASNTMSRTCAMESLMRCHVDGERTHAQMTGTVPFPLGDSMEAFESHCDALYAVSSSSSFLVSLFNSPLSFIRRRTKLR